MKKTLLAAGIAALISTSVHADVVGVYVGGHVWDNEASGVFGESGGQVDYSLEDETQNYFYIAVEHPFPFIPNVKLAKSELDTMGDTTLTQDITFGDTDFASGSVVDAAFDVSYMDYTFYYELFDNGLFSFDFGLTARDFDGDVKLSSTVEITGPEGTPVEVPIDGTIKTSEIVPMLYARTKVGLPLTGLNFFAEGNFLSLDDHTLYDYQAGVSYDLIDNVIVDMNIMAGYRSVRLELEDLDDLYSDIDFDGVFAGIEVHF
ncbi:TIGR04219 family outer membrane beta-barrel protein [Thalassotalea euphylliae]|uniref:TIGR04219 family outer membrane beta-barrel protein n=1 Tax=Thalassotalea euphylliae TaxID=1655234 RepID=UPI003628247D